MSTAPEADAVAAPSALANTHDCKLCGRTMAVISAEGEMLPQGEMDEGCELCKDFLFYFDEHKEWKEDFKEVEHRKENFQPRIRILRAIRQTQVLLSNFIQMVAAWDDADDEKEDFSKEIEFLRKQREGIMSYEDEDAAEEKKIEDLKKDPEEAAKEPPNPPQSTHATDAHPSTTPTTPPTLKRPPSHHSSPGPRKLTKRPRLSATRTRRISFDSSVVFRDIESGTRRVDAEFSRGSSEYAPGRWAAPEGSQWLDTSGYGSTIAKFTGAMKRGQKWVATKEGMALDEEWEGAGEKDAGEEEAEEEEAEEDAEEESTEKESTEEESTGGESVVEESSVEENYVKEMSGDDCAGEGKSEEDAAEVDDCKQTEATAIRDSAPDAGGEETASDAELSADAVPDDVKSD